MNFVAKSTIFVRVSAFLFWIAILVSGGLIVHSSVKTVRSTSQAVQAMQIPENVAALDFRLIDSSDL